MERLGAGSAIAMVVGRGLRDGHASVRRSGAGSRRSIQDIYRFGGVAGSSRFLAAPPHRREAAESRRWTSTLLKRWYGGC